MIIGKLNTVLDLLLNYREGIGPSTTQWRNKITRGFICEHERKETHWHVTLGPEQTSDCSDLERKQLLVWASKPEWRRRDSTASPILLISLRHNILSHRIIRAILGYFFLLLLFWQCEKSFLDLDISRYVIRIWKILIRQISLGKTSRMLQPLGFKGKKMANYVSTPLDNWHGKYWLGSGSCTYTLTLRKRYLKE